MPPTITFFREAYARLHPNLQPYPWQESLFLRLIADDWPPSITAPTGAGKTSLIPIWLIALAWQAKQGSVTIPRRLVWVVNRRVVVDQATAEAENLRTRLAECPHLEAALARLCMKEFCKHPLGISTLRGELADNGEWRRDPSRAAIVIGTVDKIGSRLLFSGYGDSFRVRAHHAGLLGHDSLIVNDEAHLTPAFAALIRVVEKRAQSLKPVRVIHLSATLNGDGERFPLSFDSDIAANETFASRFHAPKRLHFHEAPNNQEARKLCVKLATENIAPRTVIFVTRPEDAAAIAKQLRQSVNNSDRVVVLTGTQRGAYRDDLTNNNQTFRDFQNPSKSSDPCWLVATSAGEVGINISCSRLITLMDTADHLLQRFGRLNRFGETTGEARLVYVPPKEKEARERATIEYLRSLPPVPEFPEARDISVAAVFQHPPSEGAISERPMMAVLRDWVVERWTLTSINSPAKPEVEAWLHGKTENLPQTAVVWREEVRWLTDIDSADALKALRVHRILAKEKLEEPTYKLLEKLEEIPPQPALLLKASGDIERIDHWPSKEKLSYATLILQSGCGGLDDGMFSATGEASADVADGKDRARFLAQRTDDGWTISRFGSPDMEPLEGIKLDQIRAYLNEKHQLKLAHVVECSSEAGDQDEPETLLIYAKAPSNKVAGEEVGLDDHQRDVAQFARRLAECLGFDDSLRDRYEWAGQHHDLGKTHLIWRTSMNCVNGVPLAKTGKRRTRPKLLNGFRHEFASLGKVTVSPDEHRDLALHLIACHHGWARPHFRENAGDPDDPSGAARANDAMLRFARLQRQYGPWGLAYLEAVFRAADWLASEGRMPVPEEQTDDED